MEASGMNEPVKKGDQILVSTDVPGLESLGDVFVRAIVLGDEQLGTRFVAAPPPHAQTTWPLQGLRLSLRLDDEDITWARGWDRQSKRAFRAMLKLKAA